MEKKKLSGDDPKKSVMTRKVQKIKDSYFICLPKAFCKRHNIQAGDLMALIAGSELRITPVNKGE